MWPFVLILGVAAGAFAVWEALTKSQPPPPPAGPALPLPPSNVGSGPAPLSPFQAPTGDPGHDSGPAAAAQSLHGMILMVGACPTSPRVATTPQLMATFQALVQQRTRLCWDFQAWVGLPRTGCVDASTIAAGQAYYPAANWPGGCPCTGTVIAQPPWPS